jgi:hypothetical protein
VRKTNYGKKPSYLVRGDKLAGEARQEYEEWVREQRNQNAMKVISDQERLTIIQGLKKNWEELHHQYQGNIRFHF